MNNRNNKLREEGEIPIKKEILLFYLISCVSVGSNSGPDSEGYLRLGITSSISGVDVNVTC